MRKRGGKKKKKNKTKGKGYHLPISFSV